MNRAAGAKRKRRQWRAWIKRINRELIYQNISKRTFEEIGKIVLANPKVQQPSHFHEWLGRNYGLASAAGVRRLTDNRSDSISLVRLLKEISEDSSAVSRMSFVSLHEKSRRKCARLKFGQIAGSQNAVHLPTKDVDRDLKELKRVSARLRRFVNKRLAHLDQKNNLRRLPTFNDLHFVMRTLERIGSKYRLLLTAETTNNQPLPPNWDAVFFEPWKREG